MELGAFSVSLAVKDIGASKSFYEKIGFNEIGGDISQNWLIMRNRGHTIGLFQGMFESNLLTFNPGWNEKGEKLDSFNDIRDIRKDLKEKGVEFLTEADTKSEGPTSFMIVDPDGNQLLFDQHV